MKKSKVIEAAGGFKILLPYTPAIFDVPSGSPNAFLHITEEQKSELDLASLAASCGLLESDVLLDFPTLEGPINIKLMPKFPQSTFTSIRKFLLDIPNSESFLSIVDKVTDQCLFRVFPSYGDVEMNSLNVMFATSKCFMIWNSAERVIFKIEWKDGKLCNRSNLNAEQLNGLMTSNEPEAYLEQVIGAISKPGIVKPSDVSPLEVLLDAYGVAGGNIGLSKDLIQKAKNQAFYSIQSEVENAISAQKGKYVKFKRISRTPLETLLGSMQGGIIKTNEFIFAYEESKPLCSPGFEVPDFAFTEIQPDALLYALTLINSTVTKNWRLARELLRLVTPENYVIMNSIDPNFIKNLKFFQNDSYMYWFLKFNLAAPEALEDIPNPDVSGISKVASCIEELEWLVTELTYLPRLQAKNFATLLSSEWKKLPQSNAVFILNPIDSEKFEVKQAAFYRLISTDFEAMEIHPAKLLQLNQPFYTALVELQVNMSAKHPFLFSADPTNVDLSYGYLKNKVTEIAVIHNFLKFTKSVKHKIDLLITATSHFDLLRPIFRLWNRNVVFKGSSFQIETTFGPLHKAFLNLCRNNTPGLTPKVCNTISQCTFDFVKYVNTQELLERENRENAPNQVPLKVSLEETAGYKISKKAVELFNTYGIVIVGYNPTRHSASLVITSTHIYVCDRATFRPNGIMKYRRLAKAIDEDFFLQLRTPAVANNILPHLQKYVDRASLIRPRALSAQYGANCYLQSWLMGMWCIFDYFKIDQMYYRQMTRMMRQSVWQELNANAYKGVIDEAATGKGKHFKAYMVKLTDILVSVWIKSPPGLYNLDTPIDAMSEEIRNRALLSAWKEFFYSSYRHASYYTKVKNTLHDARFEVKLKKYSEPIATNGDYVLDAILNDVFNVPYYLKILALCLRQQGRGIQAFQSALQDDPVELSEFQNYAQSNGFSIPSAMLFSSYRFNVPVTSKDFVIAWELTYGIDWRNLDYKGVASWTKLPSINMYFEEDDSDECTAKAIFYGLLYCEYSTVLDTGFVTESLNMLNSNPNLLTLYSDLKYASLIMERNVSEDLNFPFSKLQNLLQKKPNT